MSMQVEKLDNNMAKLTIEVSADDFEKACNDAYNKNKSKISIPGFRKGKVPRQIIEKTYGPGVFYEDAADICIRNTYGEELDANKEIEVVSRPEIEVTQCEKGKSFIYVASVALKPEVKLGKYKGVKIEKVSTEVTDADVDAEIEKERRANSRTIVVEDRPVKDGDITVINFEGFVDGVAFEGGKGENYPLTIGSGQFIPGFEEQLIGAKIGEDVEVNVTFPEDYQAEDLAGKAAVFKCKVNEIKETELPEADDEFASEVSDFDTIAEWKEDLMKSLTEKKAASAKEEKENKALEAAVENAEMVIPDAMAEFECEQMINDYAMRLSQQGLSIDQYLMFTGMDMDGLKAQMKPQAIKTIKSRLVLEAIVNEEKLEANDDEIDAEIAKMAEMYGMEADKLKESIGDREKELMSKDVCLRKAVELVAAEAKEGK
ncbi:MAG: trigger factor [Lachnospiraceae bacterium]|jgi:trigger factor|nr:trigger factor [Lachnospiraceae bacterium]MCI6666058.1 trigger factor [Lachnospiraceae bacterium]MDD7223116.1 trigger factor [Lachnospiraceae bacterium]MDY5215897.1 trigger factor [Lachnospiraceae bacterium]